MQEKKQSSNWYTALIYFITFLMAAFFFGIVVGFPITLINMIFMITLTPLLNFIIAIIISLLLVWLAVRFSTNYIKKVYVIKNSDKLIKLTTTYLGLLVVVPYLGFIFVLSSNKEIWSGVEGFGLTNYIIEQGLRGAILITLFYFFSKKYLRNNENLDINQ